MVFVLDRDTGKPVFPVVERPVPQGGVPGEVLSPTQPFPVLPERLSPDRLKPDDVFGFTPWDKAACRRRVAALRAEGLYTPPSLGGTLVYPFTGGGANWGSAAFHPGHNVVIVNTNNLLGTVTLRRREDVEALRRQIPAGQEISKQLGTPYVMTRDIIMSPLGVPCNPPPWGELHAIDMDTGAEKWRSTLGTTRDLAPLGIAIKWGVPNVGGPAVTAGDLVFIGATVDDYLRAFDVRTGRELWKGRLPAGGQATPMSYAWKGRQYVVIAAGGNARSKTRLGDYVVAYALPEA
jgi:quinoprotein glucose dehydrogenase